MNVGPLFKRFDELADAPERIPALRKAILSYLLHAAVNSPEAISRAASLREAHDVRRRELIKNASRKDIPTAPEVADEDLPPSLADVPTVLFDRLGNIASIEKGLSRIQGTRPGKYPLVVTAETRRSSESFDFEGAAAIVPLVSSTGHGDASLKRLHYQEGRYAVGDILAVVKPICPDLLRARFIYEYLSAFKEELLVSRMVGTANVSLTVNKLKEVPVPLVSGPVLSRIDELMALCDLLEAQQEERETRHATLSRAALSRFADAPTPASLELLFHESLTIPPVDLRKSILTLALQGKLVPQDPNDEPLALEFDGPVEDIPHEVPSSWRWVPLAELGEFINGDRSKNYPSKSFRVADGVPFINAGHLNDGDVSLANMDYITEEHFNRLGGGKVQRGDVLYCLRGSLGKCAVASSINRGAIASSLLIVRPRETILASYLYYYFVSPLGGSMITRYDNGSAQPNLSAANVKKYLLPLPPLAEQRRIVSKMEQLMALVDALEAREAAARASAERLLDAVVAELTSAA